MENGNSDETVNNKHLPREAMNALCNKPQNRCIYADSNSTADFLILIAHSDYVECKFANNKVSTVYANTG